MTQNTYHQPTSPGFADPGACTQCGRALYPELRSTGAGFTSLLYRDTDDQSTICPARVDLDESMRPGAYDPDDAIDGELPAVEVAAIAIVETNVLDVLAYHAQCGRCGWSTKRFDREATATRHAARHACTA